jgi:acetylglutamate kinase
MRPKLRACLEAIDAGVEKILIAGGAQENVLLKALKAGEPLGTRITSGPGSL